MDKVLTFKNAEFAVVSKKEWLITNGIGGYASSTLCGTNTRRYHGLLVAALHPPVDRRVVVSKVEEQIFSGDKMHSISSNAYPGVIHPKGFQYLTSFQRMPFPKHIFSVGASELAKTVFMRYGKNATVIEYKNTGKNKFRLDLVPLLVHRDYHALFREEEGWNFISRHIGKDILEIHPGRNTPPLFVRFTKGSFIAQGDWYRNFEFDWEEQRGLPFHEDARSIGKISCVLKPDETVFLIFSMEKSDLHGDPVDWKKDEEIRMKLLSPKGHSQFVKDLIVSGDQFLVRRESTSGYTLIAGYHWFTDWGRDTMIAMRGLIIATGKKEIAESIFRTFLHFLRGGMIPNRFPDGGENPEYNTSDATLWLFVALYEYYNHYKEIEFIREVFDQLTLIIEAHLAGTRYAIHVTQEGLLYGGSEGVQLTWMDAKVDGHVVTPRIGCPVEINALWYNALSVYVAFGKILHVEVSAYLQKIKLLRQSFRKHFVNKGGYLHDVVIPGQTSDETIRPNQVYAVSLPFSPLTKKESRAVMKVIEEHLYTDYGLRSLSRYHPDFKPAYKGNAWERDHAYHQGTVWTFLWGEYVLAYLKVHDYSPKSRKWVLDHVKKLKYHFYHEDGLWAMSEIFDGERPGPGKGCIQQAWSVGMTLLALLNVKK